MRAEERRALAERVLGLVAADAAEVTVASSHRALTRFTRETIHQNVDVEDATVRIRAIVDGRTGVATTNALAADALAAAAARARELAGFAPRDSAPPQVAPAGSAETPAGAWVEATAAATPEDRSRVAAAIFARVEPGAWSAGYVGSSSGGITIASSAGARMSFDGTDCGLNVKVTAEDSSGYAERYASDLGALDGDAAGARAAEKARASARPVSVDPGEWTVILEPAAVGELLAFLGSHFGAQSYDEGSSFLSGRLGERVMGENVVIRDDFAHPLHPDMPFDWEGTPKRRVTLVDAGRAAAVVTDAQYARKLGLANTGHALPAPNAYGPLPGNLVLEPGNRTLDELIADTRKGLLVTRLWYVRIVDQRRTILTGMTRDGTFLIENGTLRGGVRNLRFNQSLVDALAACTIANEPVRTGGYSYSLVTPAVKFERFAFASGTDY